MDEERTQRVRERAHALWEQVGRPQGQDIDHWSQAEREIAGEEGAQSSAPTEKAVGRRGRKPKTTADGAAEAPKAKRKSKPKVLAEGSEAAQ